MDEAFLVHPLGHACFAHHVDETRFQNAGPDAAKHIFARLALQNDGLDALQMKKLPEQQAGRSTADNDNLSSHPILPC